MKMVLGKMQRENGDLGQPLKICKNIVVPKVRSLTYSGQNELRAVFPNGVKQDVLCWVNGSRLTSHCGLRCTVV